MASSPINEIYKELDSDITLLVATLPKEFNVINDYLLEEIKHSNVLIKKIEDSTHNLHWDRLDTVLAEIRNNFK